MVQTLIQGYETKLASPECRPDFDQYRVFITFHEDITEALPYLNAALDGLTDYHQNLAVLLWSWEEKIYAFRPNEIAIVPVLDNREASKLAKSVVDRVNGIWNRRNEIAPKFEGRKQPPTVLEIYKFLPRTNCQECGFPSCMAFAAALRSDFTKTASCPYLSEYEQ